MTSPHDRDGRFYGYNQDPYNRDPHRDPYTGEQVEPTRPLSSSDTTSPHEPTPIARAQPFLDDRSSTRTPRLREVSATMYRYIGGVAVSAVIAGLGAWLVTTVAVWIVGAVGDFYVREPGAPTADTVDVGATVWLAVAATLVAGALAWVMTLVLPMPMVFFRIAAILAGLLVTARIIVSDAPAQQCIPAIAAVALVGLVVLGLVGRMGETIAHDRKEPT
nr:hypothetical protein [Gordonia sp. LAM0048]